MTTAARTIEDVAREAYEWFETVRRVEGDDDSFYTRTKDGAPGWVRDLCHAAHGDMFPDDWKYGRILGAVASISDDGYDEDDGAHEFADSRVNVYTAHRTAWLASHVARVDYVQQAIADFGGAEESDIVAMIGWGQYAELREVYESVAASLLGQVEA